MDEYVVVQELPPPTWGSWTTKVSGPYSEEQAREVARLAYPGTRAKVHKIVRPVYWSPEDDDLPRFRPAADAA